MITLPNEKFKKLTTDYEARKITLEALNTECSYWLLDCFDELHFKPQPSAPNEYEMFLELPSEKRYKLSVETHQNPKVREYLDLKQKIKNENYSNLERLKQFKSYIPENDFVSRQKYTDKINDFQDRMNNRSGGEW